MAEDVFDKLEDDDMEDILGSDPEDFDGDMFDGDDLSESSLENVKTSGSDSLLEKIKNRIPKKFKSRKVIIIAAAIVAAIILLLAGAVFFFSGSDEPTSEDTRAKAGAEAVNPVEEIIFQDIVELAPFERIRLKTSSTMGLISLTISLELTDHRYRKQIVSMEDRIRQIVISQVAEMSWLELRNPDGKIRLKYDLLKRINSIFPKPTVRHIFFTHFLMQ